MSRLQKFSLFWLCLVLLVGLAGPGAVLAQDPEPPDRPPIDSGTGGGGDGGGAGGDTFSGGSGGGGNSLPAPGDAAVAGFVYDYSGGIRAAGVTVVLKGGGWQTETVTDSNGYYRFGNLGPGPGTVSLRLPPGTQPVTTDWPVWLALGEEQQVDLGYYWGETSPLPVSLTGDLAGGLLTVRALNRSAEPVKDSQLSLTLPAALRGEPGVGLSQGTMTGYDAHALTLALGDLVPGVEAIVEVPVSEVDVRGQPEPGVIRASLTYPGQLTPQLLDLATEEFFQAAAAAPAAGPAPESAVSAETAAPLPPEPALPSSTTLNPLPETGRAAAAGSSALLFLTLGLLAVLALAGGWGLRRKR